MSGDRHFIDWSDKLVGAMVDIATDLVGRTTEIYLIDECGRHGFNRLLSERFKKLGLNLHLAEKLSLS